MHSKTNKVNQPEPPSLDTYLYGILGWKPRIGCGPYKGALVHLRCELISPKKSMGREAAVEIRFGDDQVFPGRAGWSEYSGTHVTLIGPTSLAAPVLEVLCAGRFRHLSVSYRPVLRHRQEDVEGFELLQDLEEDLD